MLNRVLDVIFVMDIILSFNLAIPGKQAQPALVGWRRQVEATPSFASVIKKKTTTQRGFGEQRNTSGGVRLIQVCPSSSFLRGSGSDLDGPGSPPSVCMSYSVAYVVATGPFRSLTRRGGRRSKSATALESAACAGVLC
jgi:hypothetical protein